MSWINLSKKEIKKIKEYSCYYKYNSFIFNTNDEKIIKKLDRLLKPIKVRSAKNKGMNLQKWVCKKISDLINVPYDQQDDQCLIHSRECNQSGTDVILRKEALQLFPFSVECKSSDQFNIKHTIEQSKNNQVKGTDWMIVYKRKSLRKPVVIIGWEVFEKLFKGEYNVENRKC